MEAASNSEAGYADYIQITKEIRKIWLWDSRLWEQQGYEIPAFAGNNRMDGNDGNDGNYRKDGSDNVFNQGITGGIRDK
jgi:hypothetical protein